MITTSSRLSGWRRIANAVWRAPSDPQIYGLLELDATAAVEFMERCRSLGVHVTPTHLVGRGLARALAAVPDLNVRLVAGRAVARESVDVFFITAVAGGHDLTGVKVRNVDRKTVFDVERELRQRSTLMKSGDDADLARAKETFERLPIPLLRVALRAGAWIAGDLAKSIHGLGLEANPFGSGMVSSVGMLGLPMGLSPLAWMYRVPILLLAGEITEKPVAVSGHVEIHPLLPLTATVDHRYVDGSQLGKALTAFREYWEDPARFEPPSAKIA